MSAYASTKPTCLVLALCVVSAAVYADTPEPCANLSGAALNQCRTDQQALRQLQLEQQLKQQEQRQNQLDQQQREVQQQLDSMRQQNEALRKELQEAANRPVPQNAADGARPTAVKSADMKSWSADNPWFGSNYPKTQFAMHYAKQLQKDRPDLTGRAFLDALSTKVNETFR